MSNIHSEIQMEPEELENFLQKNDLTNIEFAEVIGVSEQAVRAWLVNSRKIPPTTALLIRFFNNNPGSIERFK